MFSEEYTLLTIIMGRFLTNEVEFKAFFVGRNVDKSLRDF